ncbi:MAG: hypothetical protein WCF85_03720 [Rhodospirillaceae bacterium]
MKKCERELFLNILKIREKNNDRWISEIYTLGMLNFWKWDKARAFEIYENATVTAEKLDAIVNSFTDNEIESYREEARRALKEYAGRHPPRHGFWYGVWQSMVAALAYSVLLLIVYHLLRAGNLDLFTLLGFKTALP